MTLATTAKRLRAAALTAALSLMILAAPGVARADRIDGELVKLTTKLLDTARDNKAKNIGVLKFRASRDDGELTFHLGPINNVMADRVENTLVLGYNVDPDWTIDVIHNPSASAARKGLSYLPAEKAAGLFDLEYPLVASDKMVKADMFLTGEIRFDTKKHTTTVVIQSFTQKSPALQEVARFTVPTERNTVAESGRSFVITRSLADRDAGPAKDEAKDEAGAAAETYSERLPAPKDPTPGIRPASTPEKLVDLDVLYNDQPVRLEPDTSDPAGRAFARDPQPEDNVKFILKNNSDSRVAVALLVNGGNTAMQQMTEARNCKKWIVGAHKSLEVDGFYVGSTGRKNVKPFRVASNDESDAMFEMNSGDFKNERLGTISMHVFVEGKNLSPSEASVTRGLSPAEIKTDADKIKNIDALSKLLYAKAEEGKTDQVINRGLIADDGKARDGSQLIEEDFKNPTEVQHLLVRYYTRKQK
jgi:hypothetical protein